MEQGKNRRRYYRINDNITLRYRVLENQEFDQEIQHAKIGFIRQADLREASHCIDARLDALVQQLSKNDPLAAEAIALINKKFSLMEMIAGEDYVDNILDSAEQTVNLSGSGIAFNSNIAVLEDTPLKLELVLYPESQFLPILGRVVSCRKNESGEDFIIAVDFEGINEDDRERIIQHILKKQTLELRKRNTPDEDQGTKNQVA